MKRSPLIVIGASAGGVSALRLLVAGLGPDLAAPILIVLHIGAHRSLLPEVLMTKGLLVKHAEEGEPILPGHIYIAPSDRHMQIIGGCVQLNRGPKENWARPAIDPLFRSAAQSHGPAAIGVILTGQINDGTLGLGEIKRRDDLKNIPVVVLTCSNADKDMLKSFGMQADRYVTKPAGLQAFVWEMKKIVALAHPHP